MADITKCAGVDCPLRATCYRHTAPTTYLYQSYFMGTPYNKERGECEEYWNNKGRSTDGQYAD